MTQVDIVDEEGTILRTETRDKAHKDHLLHKSIHVIIINKKNQILLQLRKKNKKQYPLYWNGSVAGHVDHGETPDQAVLRETREEIGIKTRTKLLGFGTRLHSLGTSIINDSVEHELVHIYYARYNGPIKLDEREIEKIKWIDAHELKHKFRNMTLTPHCIEALKRVFKKYF
ncbi:hypothetical protein CMO92_05265 [Candidatus Woesearchaeota archaeon]|nr:hypothetical protein [Candidatus Woesearchaeota archaeon]